MSRVEKYNPKVAEELVVEGLSPTEAVRVASTEMDGANELLDGRISSTQTACHTREAGYNEDLPGSINAVRAGREVLAAAAAELGIVVPDGNRARDWNKLQRRVDRELSEKFGLPVLG